MVVNGFVSVVISTIERRFDLASTESGFIASGYDIASVLCLIPVSYFGGTGHKPRWIACGLLLLGLGSFLFAMPHFVADLYTYDEVVSKDLSLCLAGIDGGILGNFSGGEVSGCGVFETAARRAKSNLSGFMFVMVIAQMLHGIGATPVYTLAVTYLDDIVKAKDAPMYLGVYSIFSSILFDLCDRFCSVVKEGLSSEL
jgi:organic anion transporter 4A